MSENVKQPDHYTVGGIETIDFIRAKLTPAEFLGYCKGNVLKYVSRAPYKNGTEDYAKADTYTGWMQEAAMQVGDVRPDEIQALRKKVQTQEQHIDFYRGINARLVERIKYLEDLR